MSSSPHRFSVLDALRGIAALGVCWYHFTNGHGTFLPDGLWKSSGTFGWLGVEIFFVISGFIIPYSLHRGGYRIGDYGRFVLKRIIRLDPPYLVGILIVIALGYASTATPGFNGPPFHPSMVQVLLHLGYLNVFFGYPWLNAVFWTLAIELQYYLLVGLLFFVIADRSLLVRAITFGFLSALAFLIPADEFLFHWLFLFMLGMAAFQLRTGIIGRCQFFAWAVLLGIGAWQMDGGIVASTGIVTALLIGLFEANLSPALLFFGHISYSLYLLHVPIGGRVINLSQRFVHTLPEKVAVLAAALATTIGAAWLLYNYVERPAQQWSSRIRYRKKIAAPEFAMPKADKYAEEG
jgi:peptidoglycan/LPS O-acetylase OafA/YrhL